MEEATAAIASAAAAPALPHSDENALAPAAPALPAVTAAAAAAAAPEPPQQATTTTAAVACQVPPRRFTPDGKVTSVDLTPDGAYVIAGCSDGTIRLYSMAEPGWGCEGAILGQIHAKGLITNLIFHVEVGQGGKGFHCLCVCVEPFIASNAAPATAPPACMYPPLALTPTHPRHPPSPSHKHARR
jgi:hypothetical protein